MRVLLVYPEFPISYWGFQHTMRLAGKKALMPPLGLITVAAMCPTDWEFRLVDMNVESLTAAHLKWAELAMIGGMAVQQESLHAVVQRCKQAGVRTVVGGPYATSSPEKMAGVDHLVLDEAEITLPGFLRDLRDGCAGPDYTANGEKPDVTLTPRPRLDLLKMELYQDMCLQYSRGCPFNCEFCDIITLYGRQPRTKSSSQLLAEMQALYDLNYRGRLFLVDDNFIGNKRNVKKFLPDLIVWMKEHNYPFWLYTEASVNLADDDELLEMLSEAGFTMIFVGIETPSMESLKETQKTQNMTGDLLSKVHKVQAAGMEVMGGFIIGFDNDTEDIFRAQIEFITRARIDSAMIGILTALPRTQLWDRLQREGRLLGDSTGDQFGMTNFVTRLPQDKLLTGYSDILATLYSPANHFARLYNSIDAIPLKRSPLLGGVPWSVGLRLAYSLLRVVCLQSLSDHGSTYLGFLWRVVRKHPEKLLMAISSAARGYHFIRYTRETVLPRLRVSAEQAAASMPRPARPVEEPSLVLH